MEPININNIITILQQNKSQLDKFGVKRIGVFGSYVRDEQKANSDIDLLVEFEKTKKNYKNFFELSEFTGKLFNKKIDLITSESLSPYIGPYIKKEVIYA